MAHTKMSAAQRTSLGFTKLPNANSLYVHTGWPGLLFKAVDTIGQALQCGGVYLSTGVARTMYFGLDFSNAARLGKLGDWGRPTGLDIAVATGLTPELEQYTHGQAMKCFYSSMLLSETTREWTAHNVDGAFLAIVSRADRGFILDLRDSPAYPQHPIVRTSGIRSLWDASSDGEVTSGKYFYIGGSDVPGITAWLPPLSGYLTQNIAVNPKAFVRGAKSGFLESMSGADAKIVAAYAKAFDTVAGTYADSDRVGDPFTLYPVQIDGSNTVSFTATRREYLRGNADLVIGSESVRGLRKDVEVPAPVSPDTWPADKPVLPAQFDAVSTFFSFSHEVSRAGMPIPFYLMAMSQPNAGQRGDGVNPVVAGTYQLSPGEGVVFTLDNVPYESVRLNQAAALSAGACFGALGPRIRPDVLPGADDEPRVLDLSERVNQELAVYDGPVARAVAGATPDAKEADAVVIRASLDSKTAVMEKVEPQLTSFSRFICSIVRRVDKLARDSL